MFSRRCQTPNLPRNLLPTPKEHWRVTLAQMSPALCRSYSAYRVRRALEFLGGAV